MKTVNQFFLAISLVLLTSNFSNAGEVKMTFTIKEKTTGESDYTAIWSDEFQSASIRTNFILNSISDGMKDKIIGIAKSSPLMIEALDAPEFIGNCKLFALNFEYVPELPEYLVFFTVKGEGCKTIAEELKNHQVRIKFQGFVVTDEAKTEFPVLMDFQPPKAK